MKAKKQNLFNKKSKYELKSNILSEDFDRITCSFYKYIKICNPIDFRNKLYLELDKLNIFGRIYIAEEGVNAQVSIPENNWIDFNTLIYSYKIFEKIIIKKAILDGISFYKLKIKVKPEIVAYGLSSKDYDIKKQGMHLSAKEFNSRLERKNVTVVDMRNYYESEVGKFENAIIPNTEKSKELLPKVKEILEGKEGEEILLYCTGGIRCEKASSYLIKNGFTNISQLSGGIINYAHEIRKENLKSKFIGKNFVFDERLGERITNDIISKCHLCQEKSDDHNDCKNDICHILFIQCQKCNEKLNGCCSEECLVFYELPIKEQIKRRKDPGLIASKTFFDSRAKFRLEK